MSEKSLVQAILFFGVVSFFLGKKALEGAGRLRINLYDEPDETAALRAANQRAA
jgi:hypothetical protein